MTNKLYPTNLLEQAQRVLDAWQQIDDSLKIGALTHTRLSSGITQVNQTLSQMNTLEAQLTNLRNQRDADCQELWDMVKRVRSGIKANYGDDSSQYEMIGGTRLSERKRPIRKAKPAA